MRLSFIRERESFLGRGGSSKKTLGQSRWQSLEDRTRDAVEAAARADANAPPDLGEDLHAQELRRKVRPTLVDIGRDIGGSRVVYRGHFIPLHLLTKDFFISVVQLDTWKIISLVGFLYLFVFFFWSLIWWLVIRYYPGCLYGASTYVEALAFATITQMTIGYGNTGPQSCWVATWLIIIQSIFGVFLEAVVLGVVFARISHPHQRSRSIFMSNKAVVARRDGILKFMFRVADIRPTQVVEPKVKAYLYTWGAGRITAEGERVPVRVEPLDVDYIDGMLLLPLIIEHTIDERSPLCGHTHNSLVALNAELVVTFEGTTEMGNPFMARRSYIPEEIYWGYQFTNIIVPPEAGSDDYYAVNLDTFHRVERQEGMANVHPSQLSETVVNRAKRTVPYPLLGENTLVLSDVMCVNRNEKGELALYCRVGDTYPNQMVEITAKMFLYRWKDPKDVKESTPAPDGEAFEQFALEVGYKSGTDRLHLRLPTLLTHTIDENSPLAAWLKPGGIEKDGLSEIVVVINAYMNVNNSNVLRQRTYNVNHHIRFSYGFKPIVKHPALARDRKPRVRWQNFHDIQRAGDIGDDLMPSFSTSTVGNMSVAPESHANMRIYPTSYPLNGAKSYHDLAELERNDFTVLPMDLHRYAANVGGDASQVTGSPPAIDEPFVMFPDVHIDYDDDTYDAATSLPHAAALHPTLPGVDRFRQTDATMKEEERNDYTVLPMDLSRYTAAVGGSDDSLPLPGTAAYAALPLEFKRAASARAALQQAQLQQAQAQQQGQRTPRSLTTTPAAPSTQVAADGGASSSSAATAAGPSSASPPAAAAAAAEEPEAPEESRKTPTSHHVSIVEPPRESLTASPTPPAADEEVGEGPLAGYRPLERKTSYALEAAGSDDEDMAAGPMHFASSKTRRGAKSLMEISSLFQTEGEDDADTEPPGDDKA